MMWGNKVNQNILPVTVITGLKCFSTDERSPVIHKMFDAQSQTSRNYDGESPVRQSIEVENLNPRYLTRFISASHINFYPDVDTLDMTYNPENRVYEKNILLAVDEEIQNLLIWNNEAVESIENYNVVLRDNVSKLERENFELGCYKVNFDNLADSFWKRLKFLFTGRAV